MACVGGQREQAEAAVLDQPASRALPVPRGHVVQERGNGRYVRPERAARTDQLEVVLRRALVGEAWRREAAVFPRPGMLPLAVAPEVDVRIIHQARRHPLVVRRLRFGFDGPTAAAAGFFAPCLAWYWTYGWFHFHFPPKI